MAISVEILASTEPSLRWPPAEGPHTREFIKRKALELGCKEADLDQVLLEAHRILGRCVPPEEPGTATGLVVGYVQSGKTLSFTTVTALARDNRFGLIILIAGTQTNLKDQSERRLRKDLGLDPDAPRPWTHLENPSIEKDLQALKTALVTWKSAKTPETRRRAVLITVLKQHKRLDSLVKLLVAAQKELGEVPALIIDDEGDQASLNTQTQRNRRTGESRVSANYRRVVELKDALPRHTFLQYTATPQANLLLSLADVLSPSFAELVTPGPGYVGGKTLFSRDSKYAISIPAADLQPNLAAAPQSLLRALRIFVLGACATAEASETGVRSMMVHPSQQTNPHQNYFRWVEGAISEWRQLAKEPPDSPVVKEFLEGFRPAYEELKTTAPELAAFEALAARMEYVLNAMRVREVNSSSPGANAPVKWGDADFWILVGGQKLDRGFTVEGLTVTYMPRPIGTGNADTLQQRARFFGYKKKYLGYCRVYLIPAVRELFAKYVEHEEFVRAELEKHRGKPLRDWKRDFILDTRLNPTRASVIGLDIDHFDVEGWNFPGAPFVGLSTVDSNIKAVDAFTSRLRREFDELRAASIDRFRDLRHDGIERNRLFDAVPLRLVIDELLSRLSYSDADDAVSYAGVLLALNDIVAQDPSATCSLFLIDNLVPQQRSLEGRRIKQPFSGKTPNTSDVSKIKYVGDRELLDENRVTVHLRTFSLLGSIKGDVKTNNVPWVGVHVPAALATGAVVERK